MKLQTFKHQCAAVMALFGALTSSGVSAQSAPRLTLFESVDSATAGPEQTVGTVNAAPSSGPVELVLVGTSQIGDRHRATLRNRLSNQQPGETVIINLEPQGSTPVPGYPGFEVRRVSAREVAVVHPSNSPCMGNQEQGVSCTGSHESRLSLATAAAVVRTEAPDQNGGAGNSGQDDGNSESGAQAENPFAAALRAARERGEQIDPAVLRAEGARFRPRRINPEDVPPGAQLIRTPFGDRIVTQ